MVRAAAALLALVFLSGAGPSPSPNITPEAWRSFMNESSARYSSDDDLEARLYHAGEGRSYDAAVTRFAQQNGFSYANAAAYAEVIVLAVNFSTACEASVSACAFAPGERLYDLTASVAMAEPTGGLMIVVGQKFDGFGPNREKMHDDAIVLARLAARRPDAQSIFHRLFIYGHAPVYLAPLLSGPLSEADAEMLAVTDVADDQTSGRDAWNGWIEAFVERAEKNAASASPPVRAGLAEFSLLRKLELGLNAEAVAEYDSYPEAVRALLPLRRTGDTGVSVVVVGNAPQTQPAPDCMGSESSCGRANPVGYWLTDNLAAVFWLQHRQREARALLQREIDGLGPRDFTAAERFDALSDAMTPSHSDDDLFDLYVQQENDPRSPQAQTERREGGMGWMFALNDASPALRTLIAARLRSAGYSDMADDIAGGQSTTFGPADVPRERVANDGEDQLPRLDFLIDAGLTERRAHWAGLIETAFAPRALPVSAESAAHIAPCRLPQWWSEQRLPASTLRWRDSNPAPHPARGVRLPIDAENVLRYERRGGEDYIVFQSSDDDLAGEVPAFGIWYAHTEHGQWTRPLYLGLQQYFPYVVTPGSVLPLVADDRLQIEVRVREMDPASITFPPIGTQLKRSEDGVLLTIDLAKLTADSDHDGMTDIEECRLGLDAQNADSDGDGIADGADPLPLTARNPNASPADAAMAKAILTRMLGSDAGALVVMPQTGARATLDDNLLSAVGHGAGEVHHNFGSVFLVADPNLFSGIATPFRFLIYSKADAAALVARRGGAPFYAPEITRMLSSRDGRTRYVVWTAHWVGGSFIVRCGADGQCTTDEISGWIT